MIKITTINSKLMIAFFSIASRSGLAVNNYKLKMKNLLEGKKLGLLNHLEVKFIATVSYLSIYLSSNESSCAFMHRWKHLSRILNIATGYEILSPKMAIREHLWTLTPLKIYSTTFTRRIYGRRSIFH